jgi:predicted metal-dependent hydrolase
MQRIAMLNGQPISYTLMVGRRNRTIRLSIRPGGLIRVSAPSSLTYAQIEKFILSKSRWILKKYDELKQYPASDPARAKQEFQQHKSAALTLARAKIKHFSAHYNLHPKKITIKNHKTLWGSCSRRGNINFNYKLALLPAHLCDYVVVHELCHLKEFNHSKSFWHLVAQTIPNYSHCRAELKKWGMSLG